MFDGEIPTEVDFPSDVAGNGPPWTKAGNTPAPVGNPLKMIRPALSRRTSRSSRHFRYAGLPRATLCR
jgi:hypothetical protein